MWTLSTRRMGPFWVGEALMYVSGDGLKEVRLRTGPRLTSRGALSAAKRVASRHSGRKDDQRVDDQRVVDLRPQESHASSLHEQRSATAPAPPPLPDLTARPGRTPAGNDSTSTG